MKDAEFNIYKFWSVAFVGDASIKAKEPGRGAGSLHWAEVFTEVVDGVWPGTIAERAVSLNPPIMKFPVDDIPSPKLEIRHAEVPDPSVGELEQVSFPKII